MKTLPKMKCFHCPKCNREVVSMTKGHTPICEHDDECFEMVRGGAPVTKTKSLNPIKESKRSVQ